jgi:peptidoglycan/LPS O-acetylase OafA/YrhL
MPRSEAVNAEVLSTDECGVSTTVDHCAAKWRNANLDALRALAVLMVLGRHFDCFQLWTKVGWAGVDLFFVLSGFLISGLLFTEWKERRAISISRFYIRRGLKIYPAFYALLAVIVSIQIAWPNIIAFTGGPISLSRLAAEMLFVQNYSPGLLGHTWSLGVEEHFYLALPLVLWWMQRSQSADPFRRIPILFVAAAATILLFRTVVGFRLSGDQYSAYLTPTHLRIDGLLFGVALSYWKHFRPGTFKRIAHSPVSTILIVVAAILLVTLPLENPIMHTAGFTVLYLGFGSLLARVIDFQPGRHSRSLVSALGRVGFYSYSIYLWHYVVAHLAPRAGIPSFIAYVTLSLLVGILMAKLIEYPVLALRDRWFPAVRGSRPTH